MNTRCMFLRISVAMLMPLIVCSCTTTNLKSTWSDPEAKGDPLTSVLVVAISDDVGNRRLFEDEFARKLSRKVSKAMPSYSLIPGETPPDREVILDAARSAGLSSILVTTLVSVDKDTVYHPERTVAVERDYGSGYGYGRGYGGRYGFGSYYPSIYNTVTFPGYYEKQVNVVLQTKIFSTETQELVYSTLSESFNPESAEDVMRSQTETVINDLVARGFLR